MRLQRILLIGCAVSVLAGCAKPSVLPPAQVLENAVRAARELRSAAFNGEFDMRDANETGSETRTQGRFEGRMQDGGRQLALTAHLETAVTREGEQGMSVTADARFVVADENEVYLFLDAFRSDPPLPVLGEDGLDALLGRWLLLPAAESGAALAPTPDPYLLSLQTAALTVRKDRGIIRYGDRNAYHYDVGIDVAKLRTFLEETAGQRQTPLPPAKLDALAALRFDGEAWIDAETFHVLALAWGVRSDEKTGLQQGMLRLEMTDHGKAEPIVPPQGAQPLPENPFLPLVSRPQDLAPDGRLPPELEQRVLDSLLQE